MEDPKPKFSKDAKLKQAGMGLNQNIFNGRGTDIFWNNTILHISMVHQLMQ